MWQLSKKIAKDCEDTRDELERGSGGADGDHGVALRMLLTRLPEAARKHVRQCEDCQIYADELVQVRAIFESGKPLGSAEEMQPDFQQGLQPSPYFMGRVMRSILNREAELENAAQTWAAVPRLAYRVSVLASLTLLIAGTWLYQQPRHSTTIAVNTQQNSEGLVEGGTNGVQDDLLLTTADR
jgi:hypothetical protein